MLEKRLQCFEKEKTELTTQLNFEKQKRFECEKIKKFSDNLYILSGTNTSACPLGKFCFGKGNIDKNGKKHRHQSLKFCPMWNLIRSDFNSNDYVAKRY